MAGSVVEFIVKAKDEATAVIRSIARSVGDFTMGFERLQGISVNLAVFNQAMEGLGRIASTAQAAIRFLGADLANVAEVLERQAYVTGTTTTRMQALQQVFIEEGLSAGDLTKVLVFMNRAIGRNEDLLGRLGITTRDASTALIELGKLFAQSTDAANKQAIALKLTGRSSAEAIQVYERLAELAPKVTLRMQSTGSMLSDKDLATLDKVDLAAERVEDAWKGLLMTIQKDTAPAAGEALNAWDKILNKLQDVIEATTNARIAEEKRANAEWEHAQRMRREGKFVIGPAYARDRVPYPAHETKATPYDTGADYPAMDTRMFGSVSLPAVKETEDEPERETPRQRRIKDTAALLRINLALAERYVTMLEKAEAAQDAYKMKAALVEAGVSPKELGLEFASGEGLLGPREPSKDARTLGLLSNLSPMVDEAELAQKRTALLRDLLKEVDAGWKKLPAGARVAVIDMQESIDEVLSSYAIATDVLNGLGSALNTSLDSIFKGMRDKTGTFKGAIKDLLSNLVTEALAILNRLAVAAALEWLLNIVFPGLGTGGRTVVKGIQTIGEGVKAGDLAPVVVNINAMDRAGIARALESPRGELRSAMNTVALAGAY